MIFKIVLNASKNSRLATFLMLFSLAGFSFAQEKLAISEVRPSVPLRATAWQADSFWGDRIQSLKAGVIRSMTPLMLGSERSQFVANFRIASGKTSGKHRGPAWNDGDCYKWIEALSANYILAPDESTSGLLQTVIAEISAAQRDDGYLHTPTLIAGINGETASGTLSDPANFEMYNMGHLMTAACMHFEATGDRSLLAVAIKAANFLDKKFSDPDVSIARHAVCPAHYMGAIDLYRTTGDERYLRLCERWMKMRDIVEGGGDDNQDRIPFLEQREAVGHAVRANYLYEGAADLLLETKRAELLAPLTACWESVHGRKIYITGGCGALYDGASPDGSSQQNSITRIHQAYGRNYQLPNSTAHNETCAAIGNVLWNHRMWRATGEVKYVDALENSLYNAVLAGVSLDGEKFFYTNTLRQLDQMPTSLRWPRQRQSWISCYCCPPNVARIIPQVGRFAYSVGDKSTSVLLYGSNRLETVLSSGETIQLQQMSDYPNSGKVSIQVNNAPNRSYAIELRIPDWCKSASVQVNSETAKLKIQPGSMLRLEQKWRAGDRIELNLDMSVQLVQAHPLVEECTGQVAVRRGPLVYCLESIDLPADCKVQQVCIEPELVSKWVAQLGKDDLSSVPMLTGPVLCGSSSSGDDKQLLYREFSQKSLRQVHAQLIPYYAWGNRGPSEMTVWIPIKL